MHSPIIILHATDASELAQELQNMLLDEEIFSLTIQETLLQGPLSIPELVASSSGVIIVLSKLLFEDTICSVIAQHALNVQKGACVQMKTVTDVPKWVEKPFNLEIGEMTEVNWGFLMTKLRSFLNFNELKTEPLWQE